MLRQTVVVFVQESNNMASMLLERGIFVSIVVLISIKMILEITIISIDKLHPIADKEGFIECPQHDIHTFLKHGSIIKQTGTVPFGEISSICSGRSLKTTSRLT